MSAAGGNWTQVREVLLASIAATCNDCCHLQHAFTMIACTHSSAYTNCVWLRKRYLMNLDGTSSLQDCGIRRADCGDFHLGTPHTMGMILRCPKLLLSLHSFSHCSQRPIPNLIISIAGIDIPGTVEGPALCAKYN